MDFLKNLPHYKLDKNEQSEYWEPTQQVCESSGILMTHILQLIKTPIANDVHLDQAVLLELFNTSIKLTHLSVHYWHIGYPLALLVAVINFIVTQKKSLVFEKIPCAKSNIPTELLSTFIDKIFDNLMSLLHFMDAKFDFVSPYERNCSTFGFLLELLDDTKANSDAKLVQYFAEAIAVRKENLWMHNIINFNFCNQVASVMVGLDILLRAGADSDTIDQDGNTAADLLSHWTRPSSLSNMIRGVGIDMLKNAKKVGASNTSKHAFLAESLASKFQSNN